MKDDKIHICLSNIKLAGLAAELGDKRCAFEHYTKALRRLKSNKSDSKSIKNLVLEVEEKMKNLARSNVPEKSVLQFDTWRFSKTSFVKGNQCLKYLFLDKHQKHKKSPFSKGKIQRLKLGHSFEDQVRDKEFPDAINVKDKVGNVAYFNSYTKYLLDQNRKQVLLEATIIESNVLVMCDILVKNDNELIDVYEIKLTKRINETILHDMAVQYFMCKQRFGERLRSFNLIVPCCWPGKKWSIKDFRNDLEVQQPSVENKVEKFMAILQGEEPNIPMGKHCRMPYACEFVEYCKSKRSFYSA